MLYPHEVDQELPFYLSPVSSMGGLLRMTVLSHDQ